LLPLQEVPLFRGDLGGIIPLGGLGEPALVDAEVGTEVGRGLLRVQHTPVLAAVDEHRHVAAVHLDRALAVGVVPVVRHVAILRENRQAVLLIPAEPLLTGTLHGIWLGGHVRLHS